MKPYELYIVAVGSFRWEYVSYGLSLEEARWHAECNGVGHYVVVRGEEPVAEFDVTEAGVKDSVLIGA